MTSKIGIGHVAYIKAVNDDQTGYEIDDIYLYSDGLAVIVDNNEVIGETDVDILVDLIQNTNKDLVLIGIFGEEENLDSLHLPSVRHLKSVDVLNEGKLRSMIDEYPESEEDDYVQLTDWDENPLSTVSNIEKVDCRPVVPASGTTGRITFRKGSIPTEGKKASPKDGTSWGSLMLEQGYLFPVEASRRTHRKRKRRRTRTSRGSHSQPSELEFPLELTSEYDRGSTSGPGSDRVTHGATSPDYPLSPN